MIFDKREIANKFGPETAEAFHLSIVKHKWNETEVNPNRSNT